VLARLRQLADCGVRYDTGGTLLAMVRSMHFHDAVHSGCDAWITVDDDVDTTLQTLDLMLGALDDLAPRIIVAPTVRRGTNIADVVQRSALLVNRDVRSHTGRHLGTFMPIVQAGFGLTGINRSALRAIHEHFADYTWTDEQGITRVAIFREMLISIDGVSRWLSEDLSFFARAHEVPGMNVEALCTGATMHAGVAMDLSEALKQAAQ